MKAGGDNRSTVTKAATKKRRPPSRATAVERPAGAGRVPPCRYQPQGKEMVSLWMLSEPHLKVWPLHRIARSPIGVVCEASLK